MAEVHLPLLERVRVASPCDARWEDMVGDDKVRHCGQCSLDVHNLSAMTAADANALLARHFDADGNQKLGRFCGTLFRRADGTVITADCPVGLAAVKANIRAGYLRVLALFGLLSGGAIAGCVGRTAGAVAIDQSCPGSMAVPPAHGEPGESAKGSD